MASIFKGQPDRNGRKRWVIDYTDAQGKRRRKTGYTDKRATERLAAELEGRAERIRDGLSDPHEDERRGQAARKLVDHLDDYETHLRAKNRTGEDRIKKIVSTITKTADECGWSRIGDIDSTRLAKELDRLAKQGLASSTLRDRLVIVKAFARFLVEHRRLTFNPLDGLKASDTKTLKRDRTIRRRALTDDEIAKLLAAADAMGEMVTTTKRYRARSGANQGEIVEGIRRIRVPHRSTLYRLALGTGLRVSEIKSLTPESFDLDAEGGPVVVVDAAYTKNKETAILPLARALADRLGPLIDRSEPREAIWGCIPGNMAPIVAEDLRAAGIDHEGDGGRVDFHALRHTFITRLVASGVAPKQAQELARHSDIRLTMERYTHAGLAESREALERVPEIAPDQETSQYFSQYSARPESQSGSPSRTNTTARPDESGVDKCSDSEDFRSAPHRVAESRTKATYETRTHDLSFTKASLYQLS